MALSDFIVISIDSGGIGDYLCLSGLIRLINDKYPLKTIIVLTGNLECLANNPRIKRLILLRNIWLKRILRYLIKLLSKLGFPFYNFAYMNNAKGMEEFIKKNIQIHYIEICSRHIKLDIEYRDLRNEIYFTEDEYIIFGKKYNDLPANYYLIHSNGKTTYTPNKEIGLANFERIVDSLPDINWVQIGMQNDAKLEGCVDYRGKTKKVRELFYIISRASAVVCLEGAYNHIASAFNIPSITIFTGFGPIKTYSYSNTIAIQKRNLPKCSPCMLLGKCPNSMLCVDEELAEKAIRAIQEVKNINSRS